MSLKQDAWDNHSSNNGSPTDYCVKELSLTHYSWCKYNSHVHSVKIHCNNSPFSVLKKIYSPKNLPTVEISVAAFTFCLLTFLTKNKTNMCCLLKTIHIFTLWWYNSIRHFIGHYMQSRILTALFLPLICILYCIDIKTILVIQITNEVCIFEM